MIPANHKWFRNLAVSQIIADTMEDMKLKLPKPTVDLDKIRKLYHSQAKGKGDRGIDMPEATQAHAGSGRILVLLDGARMGPRQYATGFWPAAARCSMAFRFSRSAWRCRWSPAASHSVALMVGLIGSALVLGAAFGAAFGGPAADRFGRKPALLVDMAIFACGALAERISRMSCVLILVGQFLVGIGIGIDFPVSASYVSETMPKT